MEILAISKELKGIKADGIAIFARENYGSASIPQSLPVNVRKLLDESEKSGILTGKKDEFITLPLNGDIKRLWILGIGKEDSLRFDSLLNSSFRLMDNLRERRLKSLVLWPQVLGTNNSDLEDLLVSLEIASFRFQDLKSENKKAEIETLYVPHLSGKKDTEKIVKKAEIKAWAVNWVRRVGDQPASLLTPSQLAEYACDESKKYDLRIHIYGESHAESLGMGSFLGVAKGSDEEAKFIVIEHTPQGNFPEVVFVGKGVTFDSGGISIKPSQGMEAMKYDMLGGAAALATVFAAARLRLPISLAAVVPSTENLPSGKALKPGDVVEAMNNNSIEIISTDAEGRLILADALAYAVRRYRPKVIVDLATLTGACVVALGTKVAGLFSNSKKIVDELKHSSEETGERVWELPLFEPYFKNLRSEIADIKNSGGRPAGAVTAALFLSKFTQGTPWAHLDIAGTAWRTKKEDAIPPGATGFGVRLLLNFLERGNFKT